MNRQGKLNNEVPGWKPRLTRPASWWILVQCFWNSKILPWCVIFCHCNTMLDNPNKLKILDCCITAVWENVLALAPVSICFPSTMTMAAVFLERHSCRLWMRWKASQSFPLFCRVKAHTQATMTALPRNPKPEWLHRIALLGFYFTWMYLTEFLQLH